MRLLAGSALRIWTKKLAAAQDFKCVSKVRPEGLIFAFEKNMTV